MTDTKRPVDDVNRMIADIIDNVFRDFVGAGPKPAMPANDNSSETEIRALARALRARLNTAPMPDVDVETFRAKANAIREQTKLAAARDLAEALVQLLGDDDASDREPTRKNRRG